MKLPLWRRRNEADLDDEIRAHLAMAASDLAARGASADTADRDARRQFGNVLLVREVTREMWGWASLERFWQDLRYGARLLRKSPGFAVAAIVTLALGIGANTAIFSVVNAVLLRPLPFPHPEQLVTLHMSKPNFATGAIPFPNFRDWQAQNHTFSAMALSRMGSMTFVNDNAAEYMRVNFITSDFFRALGVEPVIGRNFAVGEDDLGGPPLVQISEGLWKRRFGGSPDVLGKSVDLNGKLYTIVGVIPAGFDLQLPNFLPTDVYLPMGQWGNPMLRNRRAALALHGIGRIKPGLTLEQARADMLTVSRNLQLAYPEADTGMEANLIPLKRSITGTAAPVLFLLLGAVAFVLLIACVNVASLMLARSQARNREFAVRAALGASRLRMLRQLLTEALLLAGCGGALGVLVANATTQAVVGLLPNFLPRAHEVHLDSRVLLFSFAISIVAGIAFGLAPAFSSARPELHAALQSAGRRSTSDNHTTQRVLVVLEVATALVLLVGAGLMLRTLSRLWNTDPGFETRDTVTFGVSLAPSMSDKPDAAVHAAWRNVVDSIAATPGVAAASLYDGASPMRSDDNVLFWMPGQPRPQSDSEKNWALRYGVQPSYLRLMGIPLLRGRFFDQQDTQQSPVVVVVDDVFAQTFFPGQDALGRRIRWESRWRPGVEEEVQIVGIVRHIKQWGLDSDDANSLRAQLYMDIDQQPDNQFGVNYGVIARTNAAPLSVMPDIKRGVERLNAENVVFRVTTMQQVIDDTLASRRIAMLLLGGFAGLALVLSAIGIYGVIAFLVGRRTQEFGIRMAVGAQPRDVLRIVLREGAGLALSGMILGIAAASLLTRLLRSMLYGVSATDPVTFAAVALLLGCVALAACFVPARRATLLEPTQALRHE